MKKIISLLLVAVMLCSSFAGLQITSAAEDLPESSLVQSSGEVSESASVSESESASEVGETPESEAQIEAAPEAAQAQEPVDTANSEETSQGEVVSIQFTPSYRYMYVEKTNGYYDDDTVWNEETQYYDDVPYYHYYLPSYRTGDVFTVEYDNDRGAVDYVYNFDYRAFISEAGEQIRQDEISRKAKERYYWGVGKNNIIEISYEGQTTQVNLTINAVEAISFTPAKPYELIEELDGSWSTYSEWDEAAGEYVQKKYFAYSIPYYKAGDVLHVDFGGEIGTVDYTYGREKMGDFEYDDEDGCSGFFSEYGGFIDSHFVRRSVDTKTWGVGENTFEISCSGKTTQVNVTVIPNPVQAIHYTPAKPYEFIEEVDGDWTEDYYWDEETGGFIKVRYFYYYIGYRDGDVLTVEYNDGRGTVDYVYDGEECFVSADGSYFSAYDRISKTSNPRDWKLGKNSFELTYMNQSTQVEVTIIPNPVEAISFTPAKPYEIIEETNGWWDEYCYWDEETDDDIFVQYFSYYMPTYQPGDILTVEYNDGRGTVEYTYSYDDSWYGGFYSADGSYINADEISKTRNARDWKLGKNSFELTYMNQSTQVEVTIIPNPVEAISYTPAKPYEIIEETNGWWEQDDYESYFTYKYPSCRAGDVLTVEYNDGTGTVDYVYDGEDRFVSADGDAIYIEGISKTGDTHKWKLGKNSFTLSYMNKRTQVEVTIIPNPVEAIHFTPMQPREYTEYTHGYWRTDYYWDEELEKEIAVRYFDYNYTYQTGDVLTVVYNDGRGTVDYEYNRYDDCFISADGSRIYEDDFSYLNDCRDWKLGKNAFEIRYMNRTAQLEVTIVPNPVDEIRFTPATPFKRVEEVDGNWSTTTYWDEELGDDITYSYFCYNTPPLQAGDVITVVYNDGTGTVDYVYDGEESFVSADGSIISVDEISFNLNTEAWEPGTHYFSLNYYNRCAPVEVTIVPNPVEAIRFVPATAYVIPAYTSGYWQQSDNEPGKWSFRYWIPAYQAGDALFVEYNDGRGTVEYTFDREEDCFIAADGTCINAYELEKTGNTEEWGTGEQGFTLTYFNHSASVGVTITEASVASIEFTPAQAYTFYEGVDGFEAYYWRWNEALDDEECVYYYDYYNEGFQTGDKLTVHDKSGTTVEYTFDENSDKFVSQSGEYIDDDILMFHVNPTQWKRGSDNRIGIRYGDCTVEVPATVEASPVAAIEFVPSHTLTYIDGVDYNNGYIDDFEFENGDILRVQYTSGKTTEYVYNAQHEGFEDAQGNESERSLNWEYETVKVDGKNCIDFYYMGAHTFVPMNIIQNPVSSIEFVPAGEIVLYENQGGYFVEKSSGNHIYEDDNGEYYYNNLGKKIYGSFEKTFIYSNIPIYREGNQLIVRYVDGTTETFTHKWIFDDTHEGCYLVDASGKVSQYSLWYDTDQYSKPFTLGADNTIKMIYLDHETTVPVRVVENTIERIELNILNPIVLNIDNPKDAYYWAHEQEYSFNSEQLVATGNTLKAYFKDGSSQTFTFHHTPKDKAFNPVEGWGKYYLTDENGAVIDYACVSWTSNYEQWRPGNTYEITFSYLGASTQVPVSIISNEHVHNYTITSTVAPTCTQQGYSVYSCNCGKSYQSDFTEPTGHAQAAAVKENVKDATCKAAGSYDEVVYCKNCGTQLSRIAKTIAIKEHSPAAAVKENVKDATCKAAGSYDEVVYCKNCGTQLERNVKTIALKEHSPAAAVKENVKDATCKAAGSYDEVVYCKNCGTQLSRDGKTIAALGHNYEDTVVKPTCTDKGYTEHKCSRCGDKYTDKSTKALGHNHKASVVKPTCTKKGYTEHKCSRCGDKYTDKPTKALGHSYKDKVVKPTCTKKGYTERKCTRCGNIKKTNEKATIAHNSKKTNVVKPTATKAGYTEHKCSMCGKVMKKDKYTAPTGKVKDFKCKTRKADSQTLSWTKVSGAKGYQVEYSKDGKKWSSVSKNTTAASITVKKLSSATSYKFRVRFFVSTSEGNKSGAWATITSPTLPKGTSLSKLKAEKNAFSAQWKKASCTGYEIEYALQEDFSEAERVKVKGEKTTATKLKGLEKEQTYYVRIRTYKTISGKDYVSDWSKAKTVKVK